MSWAVIVSGKAPQAWEEFKQKANYPCAEPEEKVRLAAVALVGAALAAQDPNQNVAVSASGHQELNDFQDPSKGVKSNTLHISIEPQG